VLPKSDTAALGFVNHPQKVNSFFHRLVELAQSRRAGDPDLDGAALGIVRACGMEDRAKTLQRRIAVYRRCLGEGAEATLVAVYLSEIAKAELELAELMSRRAERGPS
jgi:hypothetical protein